MLLRYGADINVRDSEERTPLHHAAMNGQVQVATDSLEYRVCEKPRDTLRGALPAIHASRDKAADVEGHAKGTIRACEARAILDVRDRQEETPLHKAAETGHETMAKLLLDNGADVNAVSDIKVTPLHLAAGPRMVKLLLDHQADHTVEHLGHQTAPFRRAREAVRVCAAPARAWCRHRDPRHQIQDATPPGRGAK